MLYIWFEYLFVRSQLLWSHFVYVGSSSGRDRCPVTPVQGTLHGLLPPELGHVEPTGLEGDSGPEYVQNLESFSK